MLAPRTASQCGLYRARQNYIGFGINYYNYSVYNYSSYYSYIIIILIALLCIIIWYPQHIGAHVGPSAGAAAAAAAIGH